MMPKNGLALKLKQMLWSAAQVPAAVVEEAAGRAVGQRQRCSHSSLSQQVA